VYVCVCDTMLIFVCEYDERCERNRERGEEREREKRGGR